MAGLAFAQRRTGREEVIGFFEELGKAFHIHSLRPVTVLEQDDRVAVFLDADLAANDTGRRFQDTVVHEWTCGAYDKITGFLCFWDTATALQALGRPAPRKRVP